MKRRAIPPLLWLLALAVLLATLLIATLLWQGSSDPLLPTLPPLTVAEMRALPDTQLVGTVVSDVVRRFYPRQMSATDFHRLSDPAQHVIAISGTLDPLMRQGTSAVLVVMGGEGMPYGASDLAAAFSAIGAEGVGVEIMAASRTHDPTSAIDGRSCDQALKDVAVMPLLRSYIRAHAEELVE